MRTPHAAVCAGGTQRCACSVAQYTTQEHAAFPAFFALRAPSVLRLSSPLPPLVSSCLPWAFPHLSMSRKHARAAPVEDVAGIGNDLGQVVGDVVDVVGLERLLVRRGPVARHLQLAT
eukprot:2477573-Prymnesium_polylepis.1